MIRFAVLGAGWRAKFYLRIAAALPKQFKISAICVRNPQRAEQIKEKYNVNVVETKEEMLVTKPDFVVCCVNKGSMSEMAIELCREGVAVLSETPIGVSEKQTEAFLRDYKPHFRLQVAEQFHLMPENMAIKEIIDSGILGDIKHVQLSACHDYHAASLIRFFLSVGEAMPQIETVTLPDAVTVYNSREGLIDPILTDTEQTIKIFRFKDKTAIYDFEKLQYFSEIRSMRTVVRGVKGEIANGVCSYLVGNELQTLPLCRNYRDNVLDTVTLGGRVLYRNPFNAELTDDEIAIATALVKMDGYLKGGKELYSPLDAVTDVKYFL